MNYQISFIILIALFLIGCSSTEKKPTEPTEDEFGAQITEVPEPDWFHNQDIEKEHLVYGYGHNSATSRRAAEIGARNEAYRDIAQSISQELAGLTEQTTTEMSGEGVDTIRDAFETFFEQRLHGVRLEDRSIFMIDDEYHVYVSTSINHELYKDLLDSAIESDEFITTIGPHDAAMEALNERRYELSE